MLKNIMREFFGAECRLDVRIFKNIATSHFTPIFLATLTYCQWWLSFPQSRRDQIPQCGTKVQSPGCRSC